MLAADQMPSGVVTVSNDFFRWMTLQAVEIHPAQGVVLVMLAAALGRAAQGEVVQLAKLGIATFQNQRLRLVGTAEA